MVGLMENAPHAPRQRDEHSDPNCSFEGQNYQNPFQADIAAHRITYDRNSDQHDGVSSAQLGDQHHPHPEPVSCEDQRPRRGDGLSKSLRAWICPALDLFHPYEAFAHHELNQLNNEKNRGGVSDFRDGIHNEVRNPLP